MMNCVIIDDEPLAREGISNYVREVDFLHSVGIGNNPVDLIQLLDQQEVDLVFLDIQMPKMNGIDFLRMARNPPLVILTTAFPSYALEGYELDVVDYLLKPITFNRFLKAIHKARDLHQLLARPSVGEPGPVVVPTDYFFIKCDQKYEKIFFSDILFIQAMQNYVTIFTEKGKFMTLLSMKNMEENLDNRAFKRVHKSYIVATSRIDSIENNEILIRSFRIPVSRNYYSEVIDRIISERLWRQ